MNTTRVLQNQFSFILRIDQNESGHNPTKKHSETSLMAKVPSKINNFEGLEKVYHTFSQTFLWKRHDTPHQTSTENDPQNIVTHRIWQSTIRHTYHHSPYLTKLKGQIPTLNLPSFQKHFSNIYLFPDLTIFRSDDSFP